MKKIFTLLFSISLISIHGFSQSTDWSSKVAKIIYSNCSSCHHQGGIGPFTLMSYDDAVNNALQIQSDVNASKMPPWPPDPEYTHFTGEKVLSQDDISSINSWINEGMPSGDLSTAPVPPVFNGASLMTNIEQTIHLPEYTVQQVADEYRTFVIHSGNTESKFLNSMEFIPGNPAIVHHMLLYQDTSGVSYQKDMDDPAPGYASNGTTTASPYAVLIGGWAPGGSVYKLPDNMGFEIPANSDYVVEIHYAPGSIGLTDSTKINMKFSYVPDIRPVFVAPVLYHYPPSLINWPLTIPANQVKMFTEKSGTFPLDISLLSIAPHMHLIGKSFKVFMVNAPGDTTNLISIPDWNFHWQENYGFQKLIKFPAGAEIFGQATYDNTLNNPFNPSNPPVSVHLGESTLDEMMVCFFAYLGYQPGDENLILDSSLISGVSETVINDLSLSLFPNPATDHLEIHAVLRDHDLRFRFINEYGITVKEIVESDIWNGDYNRNISIAELPSGIYLLEFTSGTARSIKKFVKMD